ncbi:hypothetical protein FSP39_016080 [Pinctada imbricata]|uniref:RING-type domain-containing protein n=1 Tax=Pinctada imbricata TaxID=66713 RepID=A0AA88YFA8_PINIB|nr:hypothetical protein FSP39_016080 [Pinctada imbricata]
MNLKVTKEHLHSALDVILRVPALWFTEVLCRTDPHDAIKEFSGISELSTLVTIAYYFGMYICIQCIPLPNCFEGEDSEGERQGRKRLEEREGGEGGIRKGKRGKGEAVLVSVLSITLLPLRKLVDLYMYLISGLLLYLAYHTSAVYVADERMVRVENSIGREGNNIPMKMKLEMMLPSYLYLGVQCVIAVLIAYLTKVRNLKKIGVFIFTLPPLGQLCGVPDYLIETLHDLATYFSFLILFLFAFVNLIAVLEVWKDLLNQLTPLQVEEFIPFVLEIWQLRKVSIQLLIYWIFLFSKQLYINIMGRVIPLYLSQNGIIFAVLFIIGQCCTTKVSLIAFCVTISYVSYCSLLFTRLFLQGFRGNQPDNNGMRGWGEGFVTLICTYSNGFLDEELFQRAVLMRSLTFIVIILHLQFMHEMCEPILLSLSTHHDQNIAKNLRAVILFLFLFMFPVYITYCIFQDIDFSFRLLVIISYCLIISVKISGSLIVYTLFMYDSLRKETWDALDDFIYYVRSTVRVLEISVAALILCNLLKDSFFEQWSWIDPLILPIHCYFNIWEPSQTGWKTFLLRREAIKRLESFPLATKRDLEEYNDVCAICYQGMTSARITHCKHLFHATCLKKWVYVKDSCPICQNRIYQP